MVRPTPQDKINSAIALSKAILATDALPEHKNYLLNKCIWAVTIADGKYNLRYWSEGVYALVKQHGSLDAVLGLKPLPLRHEHINTCEALIDAMLRDPSSVEMLLREQAIACLVTKDEHRRLSGRQAGFDRYRAAGIRVWDMIDENWFISE